MQKRSGWSYKKVFVLLSVLVALLIAIPILFNFDFQILEPKGWVAEQQKNLIYFTMLLSLVVVIPVFVLLFRFVGKYDEKNTHERYDPELSNHVGIEVLWWAVPILLITILGVITYKTSHSLDPFKPLDHAEKPLTIQVVALQWKWLFIYPEQELATVNYVKIPTDRPIEFKLTADAPMNSFWIPELGGQIYTMTGMQSELNLIAEKPGEYGGLSANLSGEGFAGMKFVVSAVPESQFNEWVVQYQNNSPIFNQATYDELAKPSADAPVSIYELGDPQLFSNTIHKFMGHGSPVHTTQEAY